MDGYTYCKLIADYIKHHYLSRSIRIYKEISIGKTVIGKNRRIDILIINSITDSALAIECKYQEVHGTVDEKLIYSLSDIERMPMDAVVCYAGAGFSSGVLHLLEASPNAIFCLPELNLARSSNTKELDHYLAVKFKWWDILTHGKKAY